MKHTKSYIFVLWGQDFDEIAASIFVGELRRLGYLVKIVALNMQQTAGEHGVTLAPDLTLDRALTMAKRTCCVILPCALSVIHQFSYDPRLAEFFRFANGAQATFVIRADPTLYPPAGNTLFPVSASILEYPEVEDLIPFVRVVLDSLLKR